MAKLEVVGEVLVGEGSYKELEELFLELEGKDEFKALTGALSAMEAMGVSELIISEDHNSCLINKNIKLEMVGEMLSLKIENLVGGAADE